MAVRKRNLSVATCCTRQRQKIIRVTRWETYQSVLRTRSTMSDRWGCMQRHSLHRRLLHQADMSGVRELRLETGFGALGIVALNIFAVIAGCHVKLS